MCLWVAITETQILTLFPQFESTLAALVAQVIDSDLLTDNPDALLPIKDK